MSTLRKCDVIDLSKQEISDILEIYKEACHDIDLQISATDVMDSAFEGMLNIFGYQLTYNSYGMVNGIAKL